jgi:hypothetical protein
VTVSVTGVAFVGFVPRYVVISGVEGNVVISNVPVCFVSSSIDGGVVGKGKFTVSLVVGLISVWRGINKTTISYKNISIYKGRQNGIIFQVVN